MIRNSFRPWGGLSWALDSLGAGSWDYIGAVSMEDRCRSTLKVIHEKDVVGQKLIYRIEDAYSRYFDEVERKTDVNEAIFSSLGVGKNEISRFKVLGRHGDVAAVALDFFAKQVGNNLIIDISSLPKKIFFFVIRMALERATNTKNIIVTYTEPEAYCDSPLAENPEGWNPLPGFIPPRPEPAEKILVIGLGYEPLGLPELYGSGLFSNTQIKLLFPFPAKPSSVARNWDFARLLEPVPGNAASNIERVDSVNLPDTFDRLVSITDAGSKYAVLAPFGPKPLSLAMCLFASAYSQASKRPSVFYTQPTVYNPHYSTGVATRGGEACINAYCIRLNGVNLHQST